MTTTPMVSRDVKDMPWKYQIIQPGMDFPNLFDINTICVDVETKPRPDFMSRDKAGLGRGSDAAPGLGRPRALALMQWREASGLGRGTDAVA